MERYIEQEDAKEGITCLIDAEATWLVDRLRKPTPVQFHGALVGINISWDVTQDIDTAHDASTHRPLDMKQILFEKPVEVGMTVEDEEEDKYEEITRLLSGTVGQVLQIIHTVYESTGVQVSRFEGLLMQKGSYRLCLGR